MNPPLRQGFCLRQKCLHGALAPPGEPGQADALFYSFPNSLSAWTLSGRPHRLINPVASSWL